MTKFSSQREIVANIICGTHQHLCADEVLFMAKKVNPRLGIATVYRNLNYLVEEGKISKFRDANQGYIFDSNIDKHYHFQCMTCGMLYDLPIRYNSNLDDMINRELQLEIDTHETMFYGTCKKCQMTKGEN